jgi:lysophospholipase L1-like esterase
MKPILLAASFLLPAAARELPPLPTELSSIYDLAPAPEVKGLQLKKGDRLAICGDSITEQRRYSVVMEAYLTACVPDLEITCRQYGWSGEQAGGFVGRQQSDVMRFQPTIATTCYGMNDFHYVPFEDSIGAEYRKNETAMIRMFKDGGCRVILGSPGIIDSTPPWVKDARGDRQTLNVSLSKMRNVGVQIAAAEQTLFADLYRPMLLANFNAHKAYGEDFKVAGKDGVHPNWAGHVVMAYGFLQAMGLDGDLGTITFDDSSGKAAATAGEEVLSAEGGKITLKATRLPFSVGAGPLNNDDSLRAGLALVPFDEDLNRLTLKISAPKAAAYEVTWGETKKRYTADELKNGVNLAKDFETHPLLGAFQKVWQAVVAKQDYETRQIKSLVHGPEGAADVNETFDLTEKARAPLAAAVKAAVVPVQHVIEIHPAS